ncbi:MAG TPA: hypothetical protein VGL10_01220 [Gammaproteobacteria bacterium]
MKRIKMFNIKISGPQRLCVIWILCCCLLVAACSRQPHTDYDAELAGIEQHINAIGTPADKDAAIKQVYYHYLRASLSGNFRDFKTVDAIIDNALQAYGSSADLHYFRATLRFKLHRLQDALADIRLLPQPEDSPELQAMMADIAFQQGDYSAALSGYASALEQDKTWDKLARLAYYKLKTGDPSGADELYRQAQEKISAKEMRTYAWIELQRGLIDLEYKDFPAALAHYENANRAYSGYWLIEEHIAEVLHLLQRDAESTALYKKIIAKTGNPEFITALANITEANDPAAAAALYRQADTLYAAQLELYPEAAMGHLIEHLLQKKDIDPRLLQYAEENHQLRPNAEAKLLLAQTHLKLGNASAAQELVREVLQTPWRTPQLAELAKI